jgi:hypothetical protein
MNFVSFLSNTAIHQITHTLLCTTELFWSRIQCRYMFRLIQPSSGDTSTSLIPLHCDSFIFSGHLRAQRGSFRIVTKLRAGRPDNRDSIPGRGSYFSLLHLVQASNEAHLASYEISTVGSVRHELWP